MAEGETLQTGITALDRELHGGIPAGSVVALSARPASQAELLLYELTNTRGTLYLSLSRTEDAVADSIENAPMPTGDPTVRYVSGDAPLDNAAKLVSALPESANLIVDPLNVLETQEPPRFRNFMNTLKNHINNTDGLAILHCLEGRRVPDLRDTTEHMADVIFRLETTLNGDEVENKLLIPKFRGGRALPEAIKLNLTDAVEVDTSRDIA